MLYGFSTNHRCCSPILLWLRGHRTLFSTWIDIGADDIFVAVDKWNNGFSSSPKEATKEDIAEVALPDAAGAMLLTTITTSVAFLSTCVTVSLSSSFLVVHLNSNQLVTSPHLLNALTLTLTLTLIILTTHCL